ncbi:MAG TPA: prepilin-type N-terminal cleavage/methylation domain-containing protein [Candidatus Paceibacterota bacterium]
MIIKNKQKGFTLVETLIYIAGLVVLLAVITWLIYMVYGWYRNAIVIPRTDRAGMSVTDQIVREIWKGQTALLNNGTISITGVSETDVITLNNGRVTLSKNGGAAEYLTGQGVDVTRLYFKKIDTPISSAVRFEMDITYVIKNASSTKTYTGLAILKNSYE